MNEYGPEILAAKKACHEANASIAIVILIDPDGQVRGGSWGRDVENRKNWKPFCDRAGKLLHAIVDFIEELGIFGREKA